MTTIITTRAGKDLVSSLVAGLLTIGDRFGGALDGAATEFTRAMELGLTPREFVDSMRKANKLIPGCVALLHRQCADSVQYRPPN